MTSHRLGEWCSEIQQPRIGLGMSSRPCCVGGGAQHGAAFCAAQSGLSKLMLRFKLRYPRRTLAISVEDLSVFPVSCRWLSNKVAGQFVAGLA